MDAQEDEYVRALEEYADESLALAREWEQVPPIGGEILEPWES